MLTFEGKQMSQIERIKKAYGGSWQNTSYTERKFSGQTARTNRLFGRVAPGLKTQEAIIGKG